MRSCRIHRIGQSRDVYAFNFVATSSEDGQPVIEGRILERLLSKLDRMRDALGDRVFDVVGEVLSLKADLGDTLEYEGELNFEACGEKSLQALDHIRQSLLVDNIVLEPSRGTTVLAWTLWKVERGVPDEDGLTLDTAVLEVNYTAEAGA